MDATLIEAHKQEALFSYKNLFTISSGLAP